MSTASPTALEYPFDSLPAPGHTIEIAPGLRWVRMRLPFALDHINLWLLDDGEALAVVDCGFAREETREAWNTVLAADGRPLRRVVVTHHHPDHIGLATWLASVGGEALADRQLARFRADPRHRGKTCRAGLWRYSRHPNYFFEWLHWFAYVLLAVGSPIAWLAWSGPVVMYVFLRWISGIPWTEQQALRSRGEDYARYQRSTPMLIPWFPKEDR